MLRRRTPLINVCRSPFHSLNFTPCFHTWVTLQISSSLRSLIYDGILCLAIFPFARLSHSCCCNLPLNEEPSATFVFFFCHFVANTLTIATYSMAYFRFFGTAFSLPFLFFTAGSHRGLLFISRPPFLVFVFPSHLVFVHVIL